MASADAPVTPPEQRAHWRPETLALHGGNWRADPATGAVAVPIYQTTSYQFHNTAHAARLFGLEEPGNIYTRIGNPTHDVLETRLSALEGGAAAVALASGQAASAMAVLTVAQSGDNIVSSTDLYGGTWALFANTLGRLGIEARFVDPADPEAFARVSDERTRAWYGETLPNPKLEVFPVAEVAALGRRLGIPLIVDNTASPVIARPLDHGAAVVVYSATKFIGGHGTTIGGVIIDGGTFPWEQHAERFPLLSQPDNAYHGVNWIEAAKPLGPVAFALRTRVVLLRDLGAALSPFSAFQLIQGLETLPLRMRQHSANAEAVAAYLNGHEAVVRVVHPSLQTGEARRRADAILRGGHGALVGFELRSAEAGRNFIERLRLFYHVANIGDARSLAIHPATTTHSQLTEIEQQATGVSTGYVRLSIGIEHIDDIVADLEQALKPG
ncbi:O-acetylhomoserine aminocarboxypropyltransferase/cysteine synthase family protein [Lichenicoccus roseus]|uniref:Bifunctional O-acetylhomoserine aminocarboxypropyltransferase/cysteine synthase n=1 Tax=Lichenicoccus roseus TaxID=2683649 RepID=A0A5R9IZK0_9PROT|nr:PLP-dependent transferase [Lichenicoccus roseus]TLU70910.1 bifunctional O-acetylhomoserine aminocarboxypropyltransferase/cysteine synthase [Lichenicoccus roseus]